jgi:hypothetical protein
MSPLGPVSLLVYSSLELVVVVVVVILVLTRLVVVDPVAVLP